MDNKTSTHMMTGTLTFRGGGVDPFEVEAKTVTLEVAEGALSQCVLVFSAPYDTYRVIDREPLFNLYEDERGQVFGGSLDTKKDVQIEAKLDSDYLVYLQDYESASVVARHLKDLSAKEEGHPLLNPNHWFGLAVTQLVDLPPELDEEGSELKVGYRTTWGRESTGNGSSSPLLEQIKDYFRNDDWPFEELEGQPALALTYEGDHSTFDCFALANEAYEECAFYSVYPDTIPAGKRDMVMEYITRANYGLPTGNLEMDLDSGEVRFKASLDYEGTAFNIVLWERLTTISTYLMDKYSVGLQLILDEGQTAVEALRVVDGS